MAEKLALFPLQLVVYPFQELPLHIFEPRYRQLIHDCVEEGITFGIPTYFDDKLHDYGTEVQLKEVVNQYADGRTDVITVGVRTFKLSTFENPMQPKLYAGGDVHFQPVDDDSNYAERLLFSEKAMELLTLLDASVQLGVEHEFLSYKVAPLVGLSIQKEYQLLQLGTEKQRQRFLIDHISRNIPIIRNAEKAKERIRRNGHFKHFDPLKF